MFLKLCIYIAHVTLFYKLVNQFVKYQIIFVIRNTFEIHYAQKTHCFFVINPKEQVVTTICIGNMIFDKRNYFELVIWY